MDKKSEIVDTAVKYQIGGANCIALPPWQHLSGRLSPEPMGGPQFCCEELKHTIKDEGMEIKAIHYKLSTPDTMQYTQQAQKHPTSALKRIETLNS